MDELKIYDSGAGIKITGACNENCPLARSGDCRGWERRYLQERLITAWAEWIVDSINRGWIRTIDSGGTVHEGDLVLAVQSAIETQRSGRHRIPITDFGKLTVDFQPDYWGLTLEMRIGDINFISCK